MRMSICFTWFPISGLGEPNIYHDSGVIYKNGGFNLVVFLVGVRFSGGLLFIFSTIYILGMYGSIFVVKYSVPQFLILEFPNNLTSIRVCNSSLTI